MTLDQILWIVAFICFVISAFVGDRFAARVDLVALGLAFGALTFIV